MPKALKEGQGEIPGIVFVGIGFVLLIVSLVVNGINDTNTMTIFIIVGIIMMGYGGAKIFIFGKKGASDIPIGKLNTDNKTDLFELNKPKLNNPFRLNKKSSNYNLNHNTNNMVNHVHSEPKANTTRNTFQTKTNDIQYNNNSNHINSVTEKIKQMKTVKHCPSCGYALNMSDNYCYNCGTDVKNL